MESKYQQRGPAEAIVAEPGRGPGEPLRRAAWPRSRPSAATAAAAKKAPPAAVDRRRQQTTRAGESPQCGERTATQPPKYVKLY